MGKRESIRRSAVGVPRRPFDRLEVSEKSDIYTVLDGLRDVNNNYSDIERQFRAGEVDLVDLLEPWSRNLPQNSRYRQDRQSVFGQLLNDADVDGLSIVIPVAAGRKAALNECVDSIERQTFFVHHPGKVELILVQDGFSFRPEQDPFSNEFVERLKRFRKFKLFRLHPTSTADSRRRATARNIGISYSSQKFVFFLDSSMVLEQNFLAEQMLRHTRTTASIALIGFKQNVVPSEYRRLRKQIRDGAELPDYRTDWKWRCGYMQRSDNLKSLRGAEKVGRCPLVRFFHTGVTSVRLDRVKEVGGFHSGFDGYWGLEDTFLGALLLASGGTRIVPCPSSVAFMIQHRENKREREEFDLRRNREQYERRLNISLRSYSLKSLRQQIIILRESGDLELIRKKP